MDVMQWIKLWPVLAPAALIILGAISFVLGFLANPEKDLALKFIWEIKIPSMPPETKRAVCRAGAVMFLVGVPWFFLSSRPYTAATATVWPSPSSPAPTGTTSPAVVAAASDTAVADTPVPPTATAEPSPTQTPIAAPSPTATPGLNANLQDGATVAHAIIVTGQYPPDLSEDIWLFVVPANGLYYPQSTNACAGEVTPVKDGRWEMRVILGRPEEAGTLFDVVLTTASDQASKAIVETLMAWCQAGDYPGLETLPEGVTEKAHYGVVRGPEAFGPAPEVSNAEVSGEASFAGIAGGDKVDATMLLNGSVSAGASDTVWVMVYPLYTGRWYPQSNNPCQGVHAQRAGEIWQVNATFGGQPEEPYDVVVALANPEANAVLDSLQRQWCREDHYPGLRTIELPPGIEEKDRVRVYSK